MIKIKFRFCSVVVHSPSLPGFSKSAVTSDNGIVFIFSPYCQLHQQQSKCVCWLPGKECADEVTSESCRRGFPKRTTHQQQLSHDGMHCCDLEEMGTVVLRSCRKSTPCTTEQSE